MATRRQHYVWQKYLEPWVVAGKIYTLRNGKIIHSKTDKIAVENYFYNIENLTKEDLFFAREFATKNVIAPIKILHEQVYEMFVSVIGTRERIRNRQNADPALLDLFENFEESLQTDIENKGAPYLEKLLDEKRDFYDSYEDRFTFLFFLMMQLFRTKLIKDIFANREQGGSDLEQRLVTSLHKMNGLAAHLLAISTAYSIANDQYSIVFIRNKTPIKFLTSDRPTVNTYSVSDNTRLNSSELEIYYPISPSLAILVTAKEKEDLEISEETGIKRFNDLVIKKSYENIFSDNKHQLEEI